MGSPLEELRAKANTPDFRLEPFIDLLLDGTSAVPTSWGLESIVMAIQYNPSQGWN